MRKTLTIPLGLLLQAILASTLAAQTFAGSGTTTVSVTVAAEAAIRVNTTTTTLTSAGSVFNDYTGTTSFDYKIRTGKAAGSGNIQVQVTADFSPGGGPSVATPPSPGDALTYTCTVSSPGTACTGTQTSSTTAQTAVAAFGADARSSKNGNSGSLAWTLTNDPVYQTGSYSATVTFTISAT